MKISKLAPFLALLLWGCSEKKEIVAPPSYPLEIMEITTPSSVLVDPTNSDASAFIEKILKNPNTQTNSLRLQVVLGETVKNDQTKIVPMTSDSIPFDGEGKILKKPYKIGTSVQATLLSLENGIAVCKIDYYHRIFKGFNQITTKDGKKIEIPFFDSKIIKTELPLLSGSWTLMGGVSSHTKEDSDEKKAHSSTLLVARILLPPSAKEEAPLNEEL